MVANRTKIRALDALKVVRDSGPPFIGKRRPVLLG
jgi:hypothetical protein